jgi:hypothetical protein
VITHEQADLQRRVCRVSLIDFIVAVAPWFVVEEIHLQLAEELEAVARGEVDRLMIFEPPRTGKSELVSKMFPAWYIGLHPSDKVMQVSYKAELATGFGRNVRDLLCDRVYQEIFPGIGLRGDVKAAGHWMVTHELALEQQGEYYATGVTSGAAGTWASSTTRCPSRTRSATSPSSSCATGTGRASTRAGSRAGTPSCS